MACSAKSGHMGAAEDKDSGDRLCWDPGRQEGHSSPAMQLGQQTCGHSLRQGPCRPPLRLPSSGRALSLPPSLRWHRLPKVAQPVLTTWARAQATLPPRPHL